MRQGIVLQYNAQQTHDTASQATIRPSWARGARPRYSHCAHDTALQGAQGHGARRARERGTARAARRAGARDTATWAAIRPRATATIRPQRPATRPCKRTPGRACVHLGVLLGQQAVHLVHSTYFWTQYCF